MGKASVDLRKGVAAFVQDKHAPPPAAQKSAAHGDVPRLWQLRKNDR